MLTGYINVWTEQIENEEKELKELKAILKQLEQPNGFIEVTQMEKDAKTRAEDREKDAEERKQKLLTTWELPPDIAERMNEIEKKERAVEEKVD